MSLKELNRQKAGLLEELAGPQPRPGLVREIKALEKNIRACLEKVPEYIAEWPLSHEDVVRWCESRYFNFASTLASNPHEYVVAKDGNREMFERIVLHIREHGYQNVFRGQEYTQYDVGEHHYWSMGAPLACTVLINRKLLTLSERQPPMCAWRPKKAVKARVLIGMMEASSGGGVPLELPGGVKVERVDENTFAWTNGKQRKAPPVLDTERAIKRLAGYKVAVLDALLGLPPRERAPRSSSRKEPQEEPPVQPELTAPSISEAPKEKTTPGKARARRMWTLWAEAEGEEEEAVVTFEGTRADACVMLLAEQRKREPQPLMKLRTGGATAEDRARRCIVFIYPGGFKSDMSATLRESELYATLPGTPEAKE